MKVLISIDHMGLGGTQRVTLTLIQWLQQQCNAEVMLLIVNKTPVDAFLYDLTGVDYVQLPLGYINKITKIKNLINEYSPDVFLSMGVPNLLYDTPGCLFTRVKHIVSERNSPSHFAGKWITKTMSRFFMRLADGYVFQTNEARNFYSCSKKKYSVVIPNPLFDTYTENLPKDFMSRRLIVTTGRLNRQKNHPLLFEAFAKVVAKYPDYRLVVYGEGRERSYDEEYIKNLGISDKVSLPGSTQSVKDALYASSIYILSSDFEGMPNSLMEAMAVGLPCISTDCPCGGPHELINDGINGLLVPVGDVDSLTNAILSLIETPCKAEFISKNALNIRNTHSKETICRKWFDFFRSVI